MKLRIAKLGKHWWIVGDEDFGPIGPYDRKSGENSAAEDLRGLRRFYRHEDDVSIDSSLWDPELV